MKFQVENFRSVADSGWIETSDVTALIGTNESGKTNLLMPLWKLNPAGKDGVVNLLADAPRNRYNVIRDAEKKPIFIRAVFELDDAEGDTVAAIASLLRIGVGGTAIGVLLAHLVPTVGYLSLYFLSVFVTFASRVEDEARTLGATSRQVLFRITLPMMRRQITEAVAIGFLISWAQYALTLTVGGGAVHTLPLEVFSYMRAGSGDYAASAVLVMIVPPLLALAAARYAAGRTVVSPV